MPTSYLNSTLWIISLAILSYLTYTIWVGFDETLQAIVRLGTIGIWIILSLSLINYALRFLRWQWYLTAVEYSQLSLWQSFRYYVTGFAFTMTPGKAGEMIRSVFLKRHGVTYPQSLSMFFVERLSDLLASLMLSTLILWHFKSYQQWLLIPIGFVITVLIVIRHPTWLIRLQQLLITKVSTRVANGSRNIIELILHSHTLLEYRFFYGSLLLSLLAWTAEGIGFYYILHTIGIDCSLSLAVGIYTMSLIIGALSFLPGGLGGTEAAMLILLTHLGATHQDALAATLICRLATLWFAVALGALAMLGLKLDSKPEYQL